MSKIKPQNRSVVKIFKKILVITVVLAILAVLIWAFHVYIYSLNPLFSALEQKFNTLNATVKSEFFAGLSIGALALALIVFIFPLIIRKTDKKEYLRSFQRGILAATVSYISINLYQFFGSLSETFMIVFVILILIVAFILIEIILSLKKKEHDISERSKILAAIVAGLTFGILVKIFQYSYNYLIHLF